MNVLKKSFAVISLFVLTLFVVSSSADAKKKTPNATPRGATGHREDSTIKTNITMAIATRKIERHVILNVSCVRLTRSVFPLMP